MAEIQITDGAANLDQKQDLGERLAYFSVEQQGLKRWSLVILGTLFSLGSLLTILYFGFEAHTAIQRHGRAALLAFLPMPFIPTFLLFPLGAVFIFLARVHWHNGITLYEKGMCHQKGRKRTVWIWKEMIRLDTRFINIRFSGSTIASQCRVILEDNAHHHWTIRDHYDQMEQLINQIRLQVLPVIYQKMVRRLIEGEAISFSNHLKAIRNGLKIKNHFTAWVNIDDPEICRGNLILKRKDTQELLYKMPAGKVTNLDSLIHLVKNPPLSTDQSSPR